MSQALMERGPDAGAIEQALIGGDLAKLTPAQRVSYYNQVCQSLGLNPLTKPFAYIPLNGKLVLYALKDCTEQLRSTRKVSVTIAARELADDCYVVSAKAMLPDGRCDESIGAVPLAGLKGEARANAMMKAETKAKRRVTLSICGLGMLDETEVESISTGVVVEAPVSPAAPVGLSMPPRVDPTTGEELGASVPNVPASGQLPAGAYLIVRVEDSKFGKGKITLDRPRLGIAGNDTSFYIYQDQLRHLAEELCQAKAPCFVEFKESANHKWRIEGLSRVPANYDPFPTELPEPEQCSKCGLLLDECRCDLPF